VTDLLLDVGNTRLKWRLQEHGVVQCSGAMLADSLSLSQLQAGLPESSSGVYWASVAGDEKGVCIETWARESGIPCQRITTLECWQGLINGYQQPQQLGVDRWLAMVAARQYTQSAVCVVDCGSAITLDYVSAQGLHEGSYITPGARLMSQSLVRDTAQISFAQQVVEDVLPGTNTAQAVLAGCYQMAHHGTCGLVRNAQDRGYEILLCGGDGLAIANKLGLTYVEELVLDGLAKVVGLNKH
jgi:type III pantothenate kinase